MAGPTDKQRTDTVDAASAVILNVSHGAIFRRYWGSILVTLGLIVFSTALWLLQPYLLGRAIDGLVADEWRQTLELGVVQALVIVIGASRRYYDTRVYTRIYRAIGAETVAASQAVGLPVTTLTARANMLREIVRFFELRVPAALRSAINLVGSLTLLAFISTPVFYACLVGMGSIVGLSLAFGGRLLRLNASMNDQMETEVDVFSANDPAQTEAHLKEIAGWQVRRSDLEAAMFAMSGLVMTGVLLFSLYAVVSLEKADIGEAFAAFTYVVRFQIAVNAFPAAYQDTVRTMEISRRINRIDVPAPAPPPAPPGPVRRRVDAAAEMMAHAATPLDVARAPDPAPQIAPDPAPETVPAGGDFARRRAVRARLASRRR